MIAVTDTHALIWAATGKSRKIGSLARRYFQRADSGKGDVAIYVPTVSLVEISEAVDRRRISLNMSLTKWVQALFAAGPYIPVDLTTEVVIAAQELRSIPERRDRLIAASAMVLGCPLLSRDPEIARHSGGRVKVIWD